MANDFKSVIPQLLAQGLAALRENSIMTWITNTDYQPMAAQKGSSVDIPIPSAIQVQEVQPSNVAPNTADVAPTHVRLQLDQWYEAPFYLTDKDFLEVQNGTIPMQATEAIKALANKVDQDILNLYKQVFGVAGTAGTTPFAADTKDATECRKVLNNQLAPLTDRRMVIDADAEANALNLRAFQDMSFSGDSRGIIEGQINRKLGFDWFMDQNIPYHTAGDAANYTTSGAHNAGDKSITIKDGTGTFAEGDIITFAGHAQTYTVISHVVDTINISPALQVNVADSAAITSEASHIVNLAFHRDAFAWASRPLKEAIAKEDRGKIDSISDPVSGLSLRLEVTREYKRYRYSYDILYGCTVARPELACRLMG
jgi:hypothetical protein